MTKPILLTLMLVAGCLNLKAQQVATERSNPTSLKSHAAGESQPQLFDGGMMVHTGYLSGRVEPLNYQASGYPFGIGGVLRFRVGSHLRVGTEGYVSTLGQLNNGSYLRMGWGGLLADIRWPARRIVPYAGLCLGGGKTTTLLMFDGSASDWKPETRAVLHSEPFMLVNPYFGIEYTLTTAVHITLKADRLVPLSGEAIPTGVRLYLGFIFAH